MNKWMGRWTFVWLVSWCVSGQATPVKPYQLCHWPWSPSGWPPRVAGTSQLSIETNYRYPSSASHRQVEGANSGACDLPVHEVLSGARGCGFDRGDCGSDQNPQSDECGDGTGHWEEVDISRRWQWTDQPGKVTPWSGNAAVDIWQNFPMLVDVDRYRVWFWDDGQPAQHLGRTQALSYSGQLPRCYTMAYLVGFFNGVWNTKNEAEQSLEVMRQQGFLGPDWRGAPIRYELFYNQSCKRKADDLCLQDVAEVFRQRSAEMDGLLSRRWEYLWEQVTGQNDQPGSFTQRLVARVVRSDKALAIWFDGLANATLAKITALSTALADDPPTAQDTAEHTAQLIRAGQRAERAVLVAHSQGNLFVNAAYDAYLAHSRLAGKVVGEDTGYVAAQVVHIAPASPTLRGPYVLADSDVVINGLRRVDGTYLPVSNVSLPVNSQDRSGHKLLATYLDEAGPVRAQIRQFVTKALDAL